MCPVASASDRGLALLVALFVAVVVVLIGTTHLLTTRIESGIASNELLAARARHAAEAGARAVMLWFEHPGSAPAFPAPAAVLRDRAIVDESDPYGSPPWSGGPQYKEGVDLDGDGVDDLLRWPHRGDVVHALMGTPDAPDVRVDDPAVLAELTAISGGDAAAGDAVRVRIVGVDLHAPPYVRADGAWLRLGSGTIKVVAAAERIVGGVFREIARRTARLVLAEVPYGRPLIGPVHACGDASVLGGAAVGWGAFTVTGSVSVESATVFPPGFPRTLPEADGSDALWTGDPDWIEAFSAALAPGADLGDPWFRLLAGGAIDGAPSGQPQPWAGPLPPPPGTPPPWACCDRSNLFQHQHWLGCPAYDYAFWKRLARSGRRGARYFAWDPQAGYRENGTAAGMPIAELFLQSAGEPALWFFDTTDGRPPRDDDADGQPDNLTPEIELGAGWGGRGFVFLNSRRLLLAGLTAGPSTSLAAPGEPSIGETEAWVDLAYPETPDGAVVPGSSGSWEGRGPPVPAGATFRGVLVTPGAFEARDGGLVYGAVVARSVTLDGTTGPPTRILWDADLHREWPPAGWRIPRFTAIRTAVE